MKKDCMNTLVYGEEYLRMCHSYEECDGCPFDSMLNEGCHIINENKIKIVQKWSDENPEKTNFEALTEVFPNAIDMYVCPHIVTGEENCIEKDCNDCINKFWNSKYVKE